ncbi:uncharacterized protein N7484_007472 [Penicillium longicatenatum]|uniref:uncharacterized protein n=1 Tax=Penicillium longicatenatum TaxID=1561947 RepID=UPI002548B50C|nr:uncharacterized protein N7484_007472 [Penicillium longicatenatum]KAJ5639610.1 hypothetical protein N7484_007472 [Penicillium longicatenatum]
MAMVQVVVSGQLLWAYEFSEPVDPVTGKAISLDVNAYNPGILQAPLPFKVRITVRSDKHAATIAKELTSALDFLKQWE